jgi:hypothetical protein
MVGELIAVIGLQRAWFQAESEIRVPVRRVQLMVGVMRGSKYQK